jgi:hypothetical protein
MRFMTSIDQLVSSIDTRLQDLAGEIAQLEDARKTLAANGVAPSAPAPTRTHRKPSKPSKPAKPTKPTKATKALLAGQLHKILADSDGITTSAIAKQADADPAQVLVLLREAEASGDARRTGERRGTRWHAITDEDRIAARAAELASQSKRTRARKN